MSKPLTAIKEALNDGRYREEQRRKFVNIKPNYFDCLDGVAPLPSREDKETDSPTDKEEKR